MAALDQHHATAITTSQTRTRGTSDAPHADVTATLGIAAAATAVLGFDTATPVESQTASEMRARGFSFCARYLSRTASATPPSGLGAALCEDEARWLLAAGLAIVPVQFGLSTLMPSASTGTDVGAAAACNAAVLGIPTGVTLWCDLEWKPDVRPDPESTIEYANAWHDAVVAVGYGAGLYVGPNVPLGGQQLGDLAFRSYWKSASAVPWPTPRGFQLVQGRSFTIDGLLVDPDIAAIDAEGDRLYWLAPNPS